MDDAKLITVDSRGRVSLGDLVKPGDRFMAFSDDGQIVLSPVVTVVRTPENAEVLDRIATVNRVSGFIADGIRRELPQRRRQQENSVPPEHRA